MAHAPNPSSVEDYLKAFDPEAARRAVQFFASWGRYHRLTVRGLDAMPKGSALLVGNHNGGFSPVDGLFLAPYYERQGYDSPVHVLAHDVLFKQPRMARYLARYGIIPASHDHGTEVLRRGHKLLVFPGGDLESMRAFRRRRSVSFGGRNGFARLALRAGVPVVPVVSVGAHETFVVLAEGRNLAKKLRLDSLLRIKTLPIALSLPWGLTAGPTMALPYWPLPARITVQIAAPIDPGPYLALPESEAVSALAAEVEATMQRVHAALYAERKLPVIG